MMSLFKGPMRQHIQGFKDLTDHSDIQEVKAGKEVYIPLVAGAAKNFEMFVKEGDKVAVGTKLAECNERNVVPIYSSVSGTVKGIQKIMHSSLKPADHIVIENDGEYRKEQSFDTLDYKLHLYQMYILWAGNVHW